MFNLQYSNRKPNGRVEIDRRHPLAPDRRLYLFNEQHPRISRELVKGADGDYVGDQTSILWQVASGVKGIYNNNIDGGRLRIPDLVLSSSIPWTVTACIKSDAATNRSVFVSQTAGSGANYIQALNGTRLRYRAITSTTDFTGITDFTKPTFVSITHNGSQNIRAYQDGVFAGGANPGMSTITLQEFFRYSATFEFAGNIYYFAVHSRQLSDGEIMLLHRAPYSFLRDATVRVFVEPPAAPVGGRIMSSLAHHGGLAGMGGIAGQGGGLAA